MAPTHLIAQVDWQTPLENAWQDVVAFVPRLIGFLLILLIGRIVAGIIRTLITKGLQLIRFDAAMDRAGFGAPLERAGFADSGRFVALLIYYAILLLVLQMALGVFGPNPVQDALTAIVAFIPNIVVALAILVITGLIANVVRDLLEPAFANVTVGHLLRQGVTAAIWIIGGFAALDQLRIAENIVETLFTAIVGSLAAILVIKFGVGGIWAARDRFWPAVYDRVSASSAPRTTTTPGATASAGGTTPAGSTTPTGGATPAGGTVSPPEDPTTDPGHPTGPGM